MFSTTLGLLETLGHLYDLNAEVGFLALDLSVYIEKEMGKNLISYDSFLHFIFHKFYAIFIYTTHTYAHWMMHRGNFKRPIKYINQINQSEIIMRM